MIRTASAHWSGALTTGSGALSTQTGTLSETPYSFDARFGDGAGTVQTNPEELIGAAHAGCFSMQLSHLLAEAGHPPTRVDTTANVHLEKGDSGWGIPRIDLVLTADVPGIADDEFQTIAATAKAGCPVSKVLAATEITLDATLTA